MYCWKALFFALSIKVSLASIHAIFAAFWALSQSLSADGRYVSKFCAPTEATVVFLSAYTINPAKTTEKSLFMAYGMASAIFSAP